MDNQDSTLTTEHIENVTPDNQTVATNNQDSVINMPDLNKIEDDNFTNDKAIVVPPTDSESTSNEQITSNIEELTTCTETVSIDIINDADGEIITNKSFAKDVVTNNNVSESSNGVSTTEGTTVDEEVEVKQEYINKDEDSVEESAGSKLDELVEKQVHDSVEEVEVDQSIEQGDEVIEQVIVPDRLTEVSAIVNSFDSSNEASNIEKVTNSPKSTEESATIEDTLVDTDNIEIITTQETCSDTDKILAEICGEAVADESLDTNNDSTNSSETFYITTESSSIDDSNKDKEAAMTYYIVEEEVFVNSDKNTEIELKVAAAPLDASNDNMELELHQNAIKNIADIGKDAEAANNQDEDNIEEETIDRIRETLDSTNTSDSVQKKVKKNIKNKTIKADKSGNVQVKHDSTELKIPNHVLGRNVTHPNLEVTRNGRAPKQRIGVKIPHRNLTSQIVTKQDITEVLLERQRTRNASRVYGQNTLFAKRLTKALANRIVPPKQGQLKNADLISILEGTEEEVTQNPKMKDETSVNRTIVEEDSIETYTKAEFVKQIEQQLAQKQLTELQTQRPNKRKRQELKLIENDDDKPQIIEEIYEENVTGKKSDGKPRKIKEELIEIEVTEPKFKANVPVKTYGRKWKTNEPTSSEHVPPPPRSVIESDLNENQTIYITKKSSRVVKRKVIWDPDEIPARLTTKLIKITDKSPTKTDKSPTKIEKPQTSKPQQSNQTTEKVIIKHIEKASSKSPVKSPKIMEKALIKEKTLPKQEKIAIITKTIPSKVPIKREGNQLGVIRVKSLPNMKEKLKPTTPKKKLTEVDRLLMDEGAVNMLYSVKNEDVPVKKRKQSIISLDVVEKELRHKTNEILNDLQTNKGSTIMLRKKETTMTPIKKVPAMVSRQKSKDSTRSSIQSPPASPVFHQHAEASRIIRRHSSDSFSSEAEIDEMENEDEKDVVEERVTRSKVSTDDKQRQNEELSKKFNKLIEADQSKIKLIEKEAITVKYFNGFVNIVLKETGKKVFLTVQSMKEICESLTEANLDDTIRAILFTSNGSSFCNGINYKTLVAEKENAKKSLSKEMANTVKKFLLCLSIQSKILICGIHGDIVGLGVTMLPLFDVIIASESTTFAAPYGKLGCIPEGITFVKPSQFLHKALISELFYSSRILIAAEAYQMGLITRVLCPTKFDEELLASVKQISKQSPQFILSTKKLLLPENQENIEAALNKETEQLISNWISTECQKNFANYS